MNFTKISVALLTVLLFTFFAFSQTPTPTPTEKEKKKQKKDEPKVRTVTVPISILSKEELKKKQNAEFLEAGDIFVKEDGDEQTILSIRSVSDNPLALAILVQDDLSSTFNLELKELSEFIKQMPKGSRVMVAYLRNGSLNIRQKFTEDLEKAVKSLRIVTGSAASAPNNPYVEIEEALEKFDSLPLGRRAIMVISDGLDDSGGNLLSVQSNDLDRAILKAQRKSVAIYSIYSSASQTENASSSVILTAQGLLNRLSDETGGRAFFSGTSSPISLLPFFKEVNQTLNRQFAITYLSTHMKKGWHKIQIYSTNPDVKIEHPKGYVYKK
jgi:VWFA-related protein